MHEGQPIEPAMHIFAMRLSYRLVGIIQATLRPEEIHAAATEFYPRSSMTRATTSGRKARVLHEYVGIPGQGGAFSPRSVSVWRFRDQRGALRIFFPPEQRRDKRRFGGKKTFSPKIETRARAKPATASCPDCVPPGWPLPARCPQSGRNATASRKRRRRTEFPPRWPESARSDGGPLWEQAGCLYSWIASLAVNSSGYAQRRGGGGGNAGTAGASASRTRS